MVTGHQCLVLCSLLLWGISGVLTEVQFMCPRGLSGVNDTSQGPCGLGAERGSSSMEVVPGPLSITWQDTAPRPGSSYRVSLKSWTKDEEYCILQDRIPSGPCPNGTEKTGNCTTPMVYYLTVTIPDVTCDSCYLQITTIFPNGTECLASYDSVQAECPVFYTCANIRIRSNTKGTLRECRADFFNKKKIWPFKTDNPRQNFSVDFREHRDTFPYAEGQLTYQRFFGFRGRVKYQVDLLLATDVALKETSIVWKSGPDSWITFRRLQMASHGSYNGFMDVVSTPQDSLLAGGWYVAVKHKSAQDKQADYKVTRLPVITSAEVYSDMTGNYTSEGWLTGPDFDGPGSSLSRVITPAGYCLPGRSTTTSTEPTSTAVSGTDQKSPTGATMSGPKITESDLVTKSHPDESPKKPVVNQRVRQTRFIFVKSGSGSVTSTRVIAIMLAMVALALFQKHE